MADITLKLVWYRLGEVSTDMAEKLERFGDWWEQFSLGRVDLLDMLFLGWLLAAFLVVGAINVYLRFFGRPKLGSASSLLGTGANSLGGPAESCQWINSLLSWLYLHYDHPPEFVDTWLRSLNEHARKQSGTLEVKFERIAPGSLPPKLSNITTEVATRDSLTVNATVEASDITFLVSTLDQAAPAIKVANCDVTLLRLRGNVKIFSQYGADSVDITATLVQPPEISIQVRTRTTESGLDTRTVEQISRNALCNAQARMLLPVRAGYPGAQLQQQQQHTLGVGMGIRPVSMKDRRLLVKVIKANGLGEKDYGCSDPFCVVYMDEPPQKHTTSVVKSTMNPFWDEHFLFDLDERSSMIKFEVFDREKPPGDDFLGRSQIPVVELRRMPSSRQIIPLSGRPGATGTVTVEFLFMEPADHSGMSVGLPQEPAPTDSLSPRRHIETNRTLTPGGTMVTTTTTTTEKPRDHKANVEPFDESPHRIQKTEAAPVSRPAAADYSPYSHGSQAFNTDSAVTPTDVMNGGESVADVAQRELKEKQQSRRPRTPTKTSTLIITGVQRVSDRGDSDSD